MAQDNELQERWSSATLEKLRATSVFAPLFNTRYEGTPTAGAVKVPVRDTEVVVGDYNASTGIDLNVPTTTYKTLIIDKERAVNELIDHHKADAVSDNMVAERIDSAGYALGVDTDTALISLINTKGTAYSTTTALTKDTIYESMAGAIKTAKKLHVNVANMWFAVTPETTLLLQTCPQFVVGSTLGDDVKVNGYIGKLLGVKVVESDNIPDADKIEFILGNDLFCHVVNDWSEPIAVNDLKDGKHIGASAVQGRIVYGCDITRPTTVLVKKHA